MSAKRPKKRRSHVERSSVAVKEPQTAPASRGEDPKESARWWREVIESIAIAIILALLFRTFEAEAFVIPTGSMAPTLQGRHHDIACSKCGKWFRVGASRQDVNDCTCPMCQYTNPIQTSRANHAPFSGDRILVNKFLYQFTDPKRWDVIVFKFPGNAKQNYIKRLVGLPNETIRIRHGDVFARAEGDNDFKILRKPTGKVRRLMHCVHDTKYVPSEYAVSGWPLRWKNENGDGPWQVDHDLKSFRLDEAEDEIAWLRYEHLIPNPIYFPNTAPRPGGDWRELSVGEKPKGADGRTGQLITDVYAYNDFPFHYPSVIGNPSAEIHWVGDLALECVVKVRNEGGEIYLDLVEGGRHHRCHIDVSNGQATLTLADGAQSFVDEKTGDSATELTAQTKIRGSGKYRLYFANVDDQLWLWVNNRIVKWQSSNAPHSATFQPADGLSPKWSTEDSGDLRPVGIGGRNIVLEAQRLSVFRDVYYGASSAPRPPKRSNSDLLDYVRSPIGEVPLQDDEIRSALGNPASWEDTRFFRLRRTMEFELGPDQYFVLGDNSPQSKDARLWHGPADSFFYDTPISVDHFVTRDMLIGKAFFVYWPHPWRAGTTSLPIIPNVPSMGRIK